MKKYSIPKLVKYNDLNKTWYVFFRYRLPNGNLKVIKTTGDINLEYKTYASRLAAGEALAEYYHNRLKSGWNPLITEIKEADKHSLAGALELALEKKKKHVASITFKNYRNTLKFAVKAISGLNLMELPIKDVRRVHVKKILEVIADERDWGGKAYNKALTHLQALFTELLQWDIIEYSPADKIRKMDEEESDDKVYLTDRERIILKKYLTENHHNFWKFLMMIYHCGLRPVEITRITIGMIDFKNRIIKMPVGTGKKRTKKRIVAITGEMWSYLAPILALNYPKDYYLFGSDRIPGRGNEGKYPDFVPGKTQLKRDTATKRWKRLVIDGLSINVRMYALKDMGANDKLLSGVSLETIQKQMGHSEKKTTEIYATISHKLSVQEIQQKSPNF